MAISKEEASTIDSAIETAATPLVTEARFFCSIAISMKRIADSMEKLVQASETYVEPLE